MKTAAVVLSLFFALERVPYELPRYDEIAGVSGYATSEEYAAAVADPRFVLEKIAYQSDGQRVFAYVYAPRERSAAAKLPAVVYNRGSVTRDEFAGELLTSFHRLAEAGFVVIAPMYRGSGGNKGRDEVGGADLADLMATTQVAQELGYVDTGKLYLYGESRGGMMVYQALRDGFPARAAAVYGGFTDLLDMIERVPRFRAAAPMIWPDFIERKDEIALRRSAVMWAEKINTPLLIMHGGSDRDVHPSQALRLATLLQEHGKPYELIIRAGANHVMTEWRRERDAHAAEWFHRHVKK